MESEAGQHPRFSFGKTVSDMFGSIGRNLLVLVILAVLLAGLPNAIYSGVAMRSMGLLVGAQSVFDGDFLSFFGPAMIIGWVVTICAAVAAQAAMTAVVLADLRGSRLEFVEAIKQGLRFFFPVLGITIVYYLAAGAIVAVPMLGVFGFVGGMANGDAAALGAAFGVVFLLFIVVVPALLFLVVVWIAAVPAAMEERIGVFASLGRSWSLTRGHRWKIVAMVLLYFFALMIVSGTISAATMPAMMFSPTATSLDGMMPYLVAQSLLGALTLVITYPAIAAVYVNLRNAKDGVLEQGVADIFE
ncbi:MAG: hypothetical protein AAFW97_12730 [Pseudomonadota bacterium]